jgi:hypothetical protein
MKINKNDYGFKLIRIKYELRTTNLIRITNGWERGRYLYRPRFCLTGNS